eukprot:4352351-Amphidinium_carterae.2
MANDMQFDTQCMRDPASVLHRHNVTSGALAERAIQDMSNAKVVVACTTNSSNERGSVGLLQRQQRSVPTQNTGP